MERDATPLPPPGVRIEGLALAVRDDVGYREAAARAEPMVVTRRWFTGAALGWALRAALALAAIAFIVAVSTSPPVAGDVVVAVALAGAFAASCAWRCLTDGFNRTTVTARDGALTIEHGPFSFARPVRATLAECEGVRVRIHALPRRRGPEMVYGLVLRTRDAREVVVIADTPSMDHVNFVAWVLTHRVGIAPLATERRG